jgi:sorbitol-specific phosphotransferase system component IIA
VWGLPPTADAGNPHTYVVTAIYSGDANNLSSIGHASVQVQAS